MAEWNLNSCGSKDSTELNIDTAFIVSTSI